MNEAERLALLDHRYRETLAHTRRLTMLNELSHALNAVLDLDELLNLIMGKTLEIVEGEAGSLVLIEGPAREMVFRVTRGAHAEQVAGLRLPWGTGLTGEVAATGQPIIANDVRNDARWHSRVDDIGFIRAMLILPLIHRSTVIGVLTVVNKRHGRDFTPGDIELVTAFADHAALAIQTARLHQAALEKERLDHEMRLARSVQTRLLPRHAPRLPGWECAALWETAREVGGDFYDALPRQNNVFGLVIGDVADKGMHAALLMALTRSILRAALSDTLGPAAAITRANRWLCRDVGSGLFCTLFYAEIAPTGTLTYVSAGHDPALLYHAADGTLEQLASTGPLLGFHPGAQYAEHTRPVAPDDLLILYTDGVTETRAPQGDFFGLERLLAFVHAHHTLSAEACLAALRATLATFAGDQPLADDLTVIIARCALPPP